MDKYEETLKWYKEHGRKPSSEDVFRMIGDARMRTPGDKPISTDEVLFYTEQTLSGFVIVRMAKVVLSNPIGSIKPDKIKRLRVGGPHPFRCPHGYYSIPGDLRAIGCWSYQRDLENMPPLEPEPDPLDELLKRKGVRKRLGLEPG